MENQLPERSKAHLTTSITSDRIKEVARQVVFVNDLLGYKLEGEEIVRWARLIELSHPGIEPERFAFLMKLFREEQLVWDNSKGIQNIFRGLKQVKKTESGYKFLRLYL